MNAMKNYSGNDKAELIEAVRTVEILGGHLTLNTIYTIEECTNRLYPILHSLVYNHRWNYHISSLNRETRDTYAIPTNLALKIYAFVRKIKSKQIKRKYK